MITDNHPSGFLVTLPRDYRDLEGTDRVREEMWDWIQENLPDCPQRWLNPYSVVANAKKNPTGDRYDAIWTVIFVRFEDALAFDLRWG